MAEKKEIKEENTVVEENQDTEVEVAIPESKEKVEVVKEETSKTKDEHEQYTDSVQNRINKLTKRMREAERQKEEALKYAQNIQVSPQSVQQPPRRPDPKAEHWAKKNEWFGQDEAMTFAAFGIHKKLVEQEGFDASSDEYYTALDNRLKEEFPQKFNNGEAPKKASQTVAGVTRSTASSSTGRNRKVRLTPSQVTIAKKLGVPLEEYAKYVK